MSKHEGSGYKGIYFGVNRNKDHEAFLKELSSTAERVLEQLSGLSKRDRDKQKEYLSGCEEDVHPGMQHIISLIFNMPPRLRIEKLLTPDEEHGLYFNAFTGLALTYVQEWLSYNDKLLQEFLKHQHSENIHYEGDGIISFDAENFNSISESSFLNDKKSTYPQKHRKKLVDALDVCFQYNAILKAKDEKDAARILLHSLCFVCSLANFGAGKTVAQGFGSQGGRRIGARPDNIGLRAIKETYRAKYPKASIQQLWSYIRRDLSKEHAAFEYDDEYTVTFEIESTTDEDPKGGKLVQKKDGVPDRELHYSGFEKLKKLGEQ